MTTQPKDTILRKYPWDTPFSDIEPIEVDGVTYVPVTGNRIDPEMAERRCRSCDFLPKYSVPGYWVTFHRADSRLVRSLSLR